jgi:hypothetical protein
MSFSYLFGQTNPMQFYTKKAKIVEKGMGLLLGIIRRKNSTFQVMNADIVFIHRE